MTEQNTSRTWIIGGAVAAFVLIAALAAVLLSGGDDGSDGTSDTQPLAASGISETRPVTVTGDPLPFLPEQGADSALGMAMPELSGQTFDGSPIEIRNDGTPKIILFLAHW